MLKRLIAWLWSWGPGPSVQELAATYSHERAAEARWLRDNAKCYMDGRSPFYHNPDEKEF